MTDSGDEAVANNGEGGGRNTVGRSRPSSRTLSSVQTNVANGGSEVAEILRVRYYEGKY